MPSNLFPRLTKASKEIQELAEVWPCGFLLKLAPNANILVAGAYRGRVMELLATLYPDHGRLIGFDPQKHVLDAAAERLIGKDQAKPKWPKTELYNYGIGTQDGEFEMFEYGEEFAGFVNSDPAYLRTAQAQGFGQIREFNRVIRDLGLRKIHLLLLNMEGYEFDFLPHLVDSNLFRDGFIERLCMQVHWFDQRPEIVRRFEESINRIQRTHKRVFDELPQWGYWEYSGVKDV